MTFGNSVYGFKDTVRSGTMELNSTYRNFSNDLLVTTSNIRDTRVTNSQPFPFVVDIFNCTTPNNYLSFGYEPFSYNNDVINTVYNATDNFTYYLGKHTITAGVSYEYQRLGNMFMPGAQSYYAYNSLNDFITVCFAALLLLCLFHGARRESRILRRTEIRSAGFLCTGRSESQ